MRAIVFDRYGEPDVMSSREVPRDIPDSELLPGLTERILALTLEQLQDTSIEDAREGL